MNYSGLINVESQFLDENRKHLKSIMGDFIFFKQTKSNIKYLSRVLDNYGVDFIFSDQNSEYFSEPFTSRLIKEYSMMMGGIGIFAGGYIGDMAIPAAINGMQCFAYEPDPNSRRLMELNCQLNGVKISIHSLGLFSKDTIANLHCDDATSTLFKESSDGLNGESIQVNLTSLDAHMEELGVDILNIKLLQLDIEGAEVEALLGARNIIEKSSPLLIVEIHSLYDDFRNGFKSTNTFKVLNDFGYNIYCLRDYNTHYDIDENCPYELIPLDSCFVNGPDHGFNLLAYKNELPSNISSKFKIVNDVSPKLIPSKKNDFRFRLT